MELGLVCFEIWYRNVLGGTEGNTEELVIRVGCSADQELDVGSAERKAGVEQLGYEIRFMYFFCWILRYMKLRNSNCFHSWEMKPYQETKRRLFEHKI